MPPAFSAVIPPPSQGPGSELRRLLKMFWIRDGKGCHCKARVDMMNKWGPEKCRQKLDIILDWMKSEAKKRHLLFIRILAKRLVLTAIRRAKKWNGATE